MTLVWIIIFSALEALGSLLGGFVLLWKESFARKISLELVNFAVGALLTVVFLDLLPEALESGAKILPTVFGGFILFFLFERFLIWYHCHGGSCEVHASQPITAAPLVMVGDALHNLLDGFVIGASFLVSIPLGITTTFAVLAHEIPQEISDFSVLLHAGWSRRRILSANALISLTTVLGAIAAYFLSSAFFGAIPFVIALAAGGLLYIASSSLLPETHRDPRHGHLAVHTVLFFLGIAVIWFVGVLIAE